VLAEIDGEQEVDAVYADLRAAVQRSKARV